MEFCLVLSCVLFIVSQISFRFLSNRCLLLRSVQSVVFLFCVQRCIEGFRVRSHCTCCHDLRCVACSHTQGSRILRSLLSACLLRAHPAGPSLPSTGTKGPRTTRGPCFDARFGSAIAACVSSPRDWAVSAGSPMQQVLGVFNTKKRFHILTRAATLFSLQFYHLNETRRWSPLKICCTENVYWTRVLRSVCSHTLTLKCNGCPTGANKNAHRHAPVIW